MKAQANPALVLADLCDEALITTAEIKVSPVVKLIEGGNLVCEYYGCSGDCDCDGDDGCPNPAAG